MTTTPLEQPLLTRDHRRRRWVIRLCLALIFVFVFLVVAGFLLLSPSGITAEEAEAAFTQLKSNNSRANAERLLGKPYSEVTEHGLTTLSWQYYTHGILQIDVFHCTIACNQQGLVRSSNSIKVKIEGGEAWRWRWNKLKQRLGIK